ncbi:MAG TPA: hypothetical protein VF648_20455 [Pyrinomonadaceae bacterium]|jgi:hypothetical protein
MKWRKQGLIYAPGGDLWWAKSYATLPTAEVLNDEIIRVYFASLDESKFGRIGFVDLNAANPSQILSKPSEPVLDLGELGAFDDSGVNPSCILTVNDKKFLYYIGWQRTERVPYMLFGGLAASCDGGKTFVREKRVPVLDRIDDEPFSRAAPFVLVENGVFKMWYWSCLNWTQESDSVHYNNVIRYLESSDGIVWNGTGEICVAPELENDYSVGRPWVIKDSDVYRMWYSIRSSSSKMPYRIGYAESPDGISWKRKDDEVGIFNSQTGWDSEMICYPCVVDTSGKRYMFYNGNRHGSTGFGYAVLES